MRKWMNLFEGVITADDIERAMASPVIEHGNDFLTDDVDEHGMEAMVEMANALAGSYAEQITIYRGMHIGGGEINWHGVGVSWSPDFSGSLNEHGGFGRAQAGHTDVVLEGIVAHSDVDWLATFCIRIEDGDEEPELRLKAGTRITIKRLMRFEAEHQGDVKPEDAQTEIVSITATA